MCVCVCVYVCVLMHAMCVCVCVHFVDGLETVITGVSVRLY